MIISLIISLIIIGLIAGALARLVVPGKQDLTVGGTIVLGVIASVIGSIIVPLLWLRIGDKSRR